MSKKQEAEEKVAEYLDELGLEWESEYRFHPIRKWRADFYIPALKTLIEVEGGIWTAGRHTRGGGFEKDARKYNTASMMGFRLLRYSTGQVMIDKLYKEDLTYLIELDKVLEMVY